jgi:plasmid stabilization system protein ParE
LAQIDLDAHAQEDLIDIISFYNEQLDELGSRFFDEVLKSIQNLTTNPLMYPVIFKSYRRGLVARFPVPYIYPCSEKENRVQIIAVMHQRQNPESWQKRIL